MIFRRHTNDYLLTPAEYLERFPGPTTAWTNPSSHAQRVEFHACDLPHRTARAQAEVADEGLDDDEQPVRRETRRGVVAYEIPPGSTVEIPTRFNRFIHQIRSGEVVGGQAPILKRADGKSPGLTHDVRRDCEAASPYIETQRPRRGIMIREE